MHDGMKRDMFPLVQAKKNAHLELVSVDGGRGVVQRLTDMGLLPGASLSILQNSGYGAVTIRVKGTKLALGHRLAAKILVRERSS